MKHRIVFAGTSGLVKNGVVRRFADFLQSQPAFASSRISIVNPGKIDTATFLPNNTTAQMAAVAQSYRHLLWQFRNDATIRKADVALIPLHFTHVYYDRALTPLSWPTAPDHGNAPSLLLSLLRQLNPTIVVNLIDDIHVVQERILAGSPSYNLRLRELIKWREFETSIADFCANQIIRGPNTNNDFTTDPFERSPIFAIQHPQSTLARYIFDPKCPRVYTSFPISRVRKQNKRRRAELMSQVNEFVVALSEKFVVFNPTTIDEVPLNAIYDKERKRCSGRRPRKSLSSGEIERWPVPGDRLIADVPKTGQLAWNDLRDVSTPDETDPERRTIIGRQVVARDLRLVSQADCIAIYRPTGPGRKVWSRGTLNEFAAAQGQAEGHRPFVKIFVLRDKTDGPLQNAKDVRTSGTFAAQSSCVRVIEARGLDTPEGRRKGIGRLVQAIENERDNLTARRLAAN